MAFTRNRIFKILICLFISYTGSTQTVYYPVNSSQLLKSTVADAAMLLQKAMGGNNFGIQEYTLMPSSGIVFIYDSAITDNQLCRVESNGTTFIKFTASQDNGLVFGIYQYLEELGFRFYQPGSIWEITPTLISPYKILNKSYSSNYKYKSWFISGGHNRWIMDNNDNYGWDIYYGDNGHNWALYQRRNSMTGGYRFTGHRGDIMNGNYLTTLQNNPCYVACYDGSRQATQQSVPDIKSNPAMQLWSNTIEQKYTQYKNIIFGNTGLYTDDYRNFNYNHEYIGIEVPDGSQWGNSKDNSGCSNTDYPSATDQNFTLANFMANKINQTYTSRHLQLYAYSNHADVPSQNITINSKIDIQVVPTAFQNETSAKGLLNRWYNKSINISEYQYLNIAQWGGETPMFYLSDLKNTLQRLKEKNSQGILWEASPAKFVSLPFLWAANKSLIGNNNVDASLSEFCNAMFGPASVQINKLLRQWSDDNTITVGDFIQDNKYKIPLYLQLLNTAVQQTQTSPDIIQQRIRELKAYLHYMVLYYDWYFDQRNSAGKTAKAAALCIYLAKINKLQLVNSYFIIEDIVSRYSISDPFYIAYNVVNGTAYEHGNLPLVTGVEIDLNFLNDYNVYTQTISTYDLKDAASIINKIPNSNITPADQINVKIGFTNAADYSNRSEFYINAMSLSSVDIMYTPHFEMAGKGYINFTVEVADKPLQVVKDFSITANAGAGKLTVRFPAAGTYKLSVISKYKSSVDLSIVTNGNYFYKNTAFFGNKTENYRTDLTSLPGYFYVPEGMQKIYFSINNRGLAYPTVEEISKAFVFRNAEGKNVEPHLSGINDSALFYLEIPDGQDGKFWQLFKMEQYNLCFANISNIEWYVKRKPCNDADFKISVINNNGNCFTRLSSDADSTNLNWQVYNEGSWLTFSGVNKVDLPDDISPNAIVTLSKNEGCSFTKRLSADENYLRSKEACATGAALPELLVAVTPILYPNPSTGQYTIMQNAANIIAEEITLFNAQGEMILHIKNKGQLNITSQPAEIYFFKVKLKEKFYTGKLIKL